MERAAPTSKTIILTGGTRGLGWEMAEALIDAGHRVVIYDHRGSGRSDAPPGLYTIEQMRERPQFVEISSAGMRESHVHDVQITKEAPNYHAE